MLRQAMSRQCGTGSGKAGNVSVCDVTKQCGAQRQGRQRMSTSGVSVLVGVAIGMVMVRQAYACPRTTRLVGVGRRVVRQAKLVEVQSRQFLERPGGVRQASRV